MIKAIIASLALTFSVSAFAAPSVADVVVQAQLPAIAEQAQTLGLNWKVGDTANYNLDMGGFIKGKMVMSVKSIGDDGIWMQQDMDLGFAGKQNVETLIDPNTGAVKKMIVNGKEQEVPKQDVEVVDIKEDKITVPAGTFECIHAILKDKKDNSEINAWINPELIPMSGLLKQIAPSQFGKVVVELTSFSKK
ncbi:hypothetical protein ACLVWU_00195 [Bdellovibrio sp. HCB290]|uniref:hypothetical protein n=1 Tax=Bdellovibrio sp. HCB290 TaxID=3394356 RepID=UPI0039B5637D